jgi:hypothetical protein
MWSRILCFLLFFVLIFSSSRITAQYNELGIMVGGMNYKGELSRHLFNTNFIHPGFGLFYRHNWDRRWSYKVEMNFGKISGDDAFAKTPFELDRNLSFRSAIFEIGPQVEFNFLPYETGNSQFPFTPYLTSGFMIFKFNPKADLGDESYELQPLGTEGQGTNGEKKYKRTQLALVIGGGLKLTVGRLGIGLEVGARRTYSDYLDDVSTVYPDMAALQASSGTPAVLLSDRSFSRLDTTSMITDPHFKQRGNAHDKDWYMFTGITLYWRMSSLWRDMCKPFRERRYN